MLGAIIYVISSIYVSITIGGWVEYNYGDYVISNGQSASWVVGRRSFIS